MNNNLITAAEAALFELKCAHRALECPMPDNCPTSRAIASLEVEIAKAKRAELATQDPEFQAVAGFDINEHLPKMVNPPPITVANMESCDILDAINRAAPKAFMPSAHRICWQCDQILHDSTPESTNLCRHCRP